MIPAPSGAPRGIGIVCDSYNACQIRCTPGTDKEKLNEMAMNDEDNNNNNGNGNGKQENLPFSDASITMLNTKEKSRGHVPHKKSSHLGTNKKIF